MKKQATLFSFLKSPVPEVRRNISITSSSSHIEKDVGLDLVQDIDNDKPNAYELGSTTSNNICESSSDKPGPSSANINTTMPNVSSHNWLQNRSNPLLNLKRKNNSEPTDKSLPKLSKRKFNKDWLMQFDWLIFDTTSNLASCKYCKQVAASGVDAKWVTGFSMPFKRESFLFHGKSKIHIQNIQIVKAKDLPMETPMAKCIKKMDQEMFQHLTHLFNVAYYIAKHEKPFKDFDDLLSLASKLNVNILKHYGNEKQCKTFIHFISQTLKNDILLNLKKSKFISILIDGSTDKTSEEHANVYVRYVNNGTVKEDILGVIDLPNSTSLGYFTALTELLDKVLGPNMYRNKCYIIGLGTDGAANMVGHKSGLAVKMKELCPSLLSVHCVAHRMQLAILDVSNKVDYLKVFDSVVRNIFKFYHGSAKRLHNLKETAAILEEEILKLSDIHTVRWLASKVTAVRALLQSWKAVVIHLEQLTNGNDNDSSKAKGLLKDLTQFKFVKLLHFLMDFYSKLNPLSVSLQSKEIMVSSLKFKVEHSITTLEELSYNMGPSEKQFLDCTSLSGMFKDVQLLNVQNGDQQFQEIRIKVITNAKIYLRERLESVSSDIISNLHIFDSMGWPGKETILHFGTEEIKQLFMYLNPTDYQDKIDILLAEWAEYKFLFSSLNFTETLKKISIEMERFPNLFSIVTFCATLPVTTSSCERGFSYHNRIKTVYRNSLKTETLDDLLMIAVNGPTLSEFDPKFAIDKWYFSAERQRYTNIHN